MFTRTVVSTASLLLLTGFGAYGSRVGTQFFTGSWSCSGGTPAGRQMNSDVVFTPVLDGHFLEARHVDRPPGRYESVAMWPLDTAAGHFSTVVYDNFGGARHFAAEVSGAAAVVLVRDTLEQGARAESFTYRASSESTYWYAWYVRRAAGQPLALGDSATCHRIH
ncbi:MAG: hypothetical protein ABIY52_07635 [Gemmatimonadaceae bacterium]